MASRTTKIVLLALPLLASLASCHHLPFRRRPRIRPPLVHVPRVAPRVPHVSPWRVAAHIRRASRVAAGYSLLAGLHSRAYVGWPWLVGVDPLSDTYRLRLRTRRAKARAAGDLIAGYRLAAHLYWWHALHAASLRSAEARLLAVRLANLREALAIATAAKAKRDLQAEIAATNLRLVALVTPGDDWLADARKSDYWAECRPEPFRPFYRKDHTPTDAELALLKQHLVALAEHLRAAAKAARKEGLTAEADGLVALADRADAIRGQAAAGEYEVVRTGLDQFWAGVIELEVTV